MKRWRAAATRASQRKRDFPERSSSLQETGRVHLRRGGAQLHGGPGRGLQAGDHREREGVCVHGLRHRHPEGLGLEEGGGPGHPHAVWRR